MFDTLFERLANGSLKVRERPDGVAFFVATKELYGFSSISYLGLNIRIHASSGCVVHCSYSDARVKHCIAKEQFSLEGLAACGLSGDEPFEWPAAGSQGTNPRQLVFPLRPRGSEIAFLGISSPMQEEDWERTKKSGMQDIKALGHYFHSHVLRINGHDTENDMLVSARELDCLKWTAAGKTAWEASVILGISERTVRFHLNAAREKLKCATTTQAVAKAISRQLIDV